MLLEGFLRHLTERQWVQPSDRLLVAVSGGIDSMVMLHLFARTSLQFGVVHCNFCLRGEASDADEALVRGTVQAMQRPFYCTRFDTTAYAASHRLSIQMAARELRYTYFDRLCREDGYTAVAVAHHVDDDVETFFINLGRGTGLRGLTGMHQGGGRVVRPMLFTSRREIVAYAAAHGIVWREDASNASDKYLRNNIRHHLLPAMEQIFPDYRDGMRHTMELLTDAEAMFEAYLQQMRDLYVHADGERTIIDSALLQHAAAPRTVLYELLHPFGFSTAQTDMLCRMTAHGLHPGQQLLSSRFVLQTGRGMLVVTPRTAPADEEVVWPDGVEELTYPLHLRKVYCPAAGYELERSAAVAQLDAARVTGDLTLRHWRPGDFFCPLGMKGRQKLSDYWINHKVPLDEKQRRWLLCHGDDVVWVVGERIDARYAVAPSTSQVLKISLS